MNLILPKSFQKHLHAFSRRGLLAFFRKASPYGVGIVFFGMALWLGYLWYVSVYAYSWTEEQKDQYRSTYASQTSFREERFLQTVNLLKERITIHETPPVVTKNIFTGANL